MNGLIDELKNNIEVTADLLYRQKIEEAKQSMTTTIDLITQVIGQITDEDKINKLVVILNEALNAMEEDDNVLLADIIQYDLMELIENLM